MSRWSTLSHRQQGLLLTDGDAMIMAPDALLIKNDTGQFAVNRCRSLLGPSQGTFTQGHLAGD